MTTVDLFRATRIGTLWMSSGAAATSVCSALGAWKFRIRSAKAKRKVRILYVPPLRTATSLFPAPIWLRSVAAIKVVSLSFPMKVTK
jgi:hypothetical protein